MHELSITQHILQYALEESEKRGASRVLAIHLKMGPLSGLVPECIQMYLALLSEGTIAEGAAAKAQVLPRQVRCRDCHAESEITRHSLACPVCQSLRLQLLSGREFYIDGLEVEIHGNQSASSGNGME